VCVRVCGCITQLGIPFLKFRPSSHTHSPHFAAIHSDQSLQPFPPPHSSSNFEALQRSSPFLCPDFQGSIPDCSMGRNVSFHTSFDPIRLFRLSVSPLVAIPYDRFHLAQ